MATKSNGKRGGAIEVKRQYLSQADVPSRGLDQALCVPQAIADNYGKNPTKPSRMAFRPGRGPPIGRWSGQLGRSSQTAFWESVLGNGTVVSGLTLRLKAVGNCGIAHRRFELEMLKESDF